MPSKKIIMPLILVTILGGGWWFFPNTQKHPIENKIAAADNDAWKILSSDSDNDGLKDWEELLWKTDPRNPDTDGDGTTDNEEILAKRDPRKPGPDDLMDISPADLTDGITAEVSNEENFTAKLAQNFATSYFSRKIASASEGYDLLQKDTLTDQVFSDIARTMTQKDVIDNIPRFSAQDFQVSASVSEHDVRNYINNLGKIFQSADFPEKSDIEAISEAIVKQEKDLAGIKDLQLYQNGYEKLAQDMKTISVPQSFIETHVAMANNFWRLGLYLKEFINMEADPIKGMIALNGYSKEGMQSIELLKKIVEEIKIKRFSFSQEEGGSEFNKYLSI